MYDRRRCSLGFVISAISVLLYIETFSWREYAEEMSVEAKAAGAQECLTLLAISCSALTSIYAMHHIGPVRIMIIIDEVRDEMRAGGTTGLMPHFLWVMCC